MDRNVEISEGSRLYFFPVSGCGWNIKYLGKTNMNESKLDEELEIETENNPLVDPETIPYEIYCHTNKVNGKRYVGFTKNGIMKRWAEHIKEIKYNKYYFKNAIKKYGLDAWEHEVLEVVIGLTKACEAEVKWIATYESNNPKFGYNPTAGGDSMCFSKEERAANNTKYKTKYKFGKEEILCFAAQSLQYSDLASKLNIPKKRLEFKVNKLNIRNEVNALILKNQNASIKIETVINLAKTYKNRNLVAKKLNCSNIFIYNFVKYNNLSKYFKEDSEEIKKELEVEQNNLKNKIIELAKKSLTVKQLVHACGKSHLFYFSETLKVLNIKDEVYKIINKNKEIVAGIGYYPDLVSKKIGAQPKDFSWMIGKPFGSLMVLEILEPCLKRKAKTKCKCGSVSETRIDGLLSGHTKHCNNKSLHRKGKIATLQAKQNMSLAQKERNKNNPLPHSFANLTFEQRSLYKTKFKFSEEELIETAKLCKNINEMLEKLEIKTAITLKKLLIKRGVLNQVDEILKENELLQSKQEVL